MTWLKKSFYVLTMIAIATMVSGCSSKDNKVDSSTNVFTIWSFEDEDVWKPIITAAQKELKGYEIKYVKKTLNDSYENDSLNSILSGKGPDIWAMPNDWVFRHKDKLYPLHTERLEKDYSINIKDQYIPALVDSVFFDDNLFAFSKGADSLVLYYNPKIFEKARSEYSTTNTLPERGLNEDNQTYYSRPDVKKITDKLNILSNYPRTWEEFSEAVKIISNRESGRIERSAAALGSANNITEAADIIYTLIMQNGGSVINKELTLGTFNLSEPTTSGANELIGKNAFDFFTSFSDPSSDLFTWNNTFEKDVDSFAKGNTSMIFGYGRLREYLSQKYPEFIYKIAPFPQITTDANSHKFFSSFRTLAVPNLSNHKDVAWNLIFQSPAAIHEGSPTQIVADDALPVITFDSSSSDVLKYQCQKARVINKGRYPKEIDGIIRKYLMRIDYNKFNSQVAVDSAANEVNALLRKKDW